MALTSYISALHRTLIEIMRGDDRVICFGEFAELKRPPTGESITDVFGPDRLIPVPVSELGYAGAAIGAALSGMRPIVFYSNASFMLYAWEQLVNEAPNLHYMSGGQISVP